MDAVSSIASLQQGWIEERRQSLELLQVAFELFLPSGEHPSGQEMGKASNSTVIGWKWGMRSAMEGNCWHHLSSVGATRSSKRWATYRKKRSTGWALGPPAMK